MLNRLMQYMYMISEFFWSNQGHFPCARIMLRHDFMCPLCLMKQASNKDCKVRFPIPSTCEIRHRTLIQPGNLWYKCRHYNTMNKLVTHTWMVCRYSVLTCLFSLACCRTSNNSSTEASNVSLSAVTLRNISVMTWDSILPYGVHTHKTY